MNNETRTCQSCKTAFTIEPDDFAFYEKIQVPPPTWCPECRGKRRMIWWNERNLFRKKEALGGKEIFSTYPEGSDVVIYGHDDWWSDKWDALSYGQDPDFSKPFLAQVQELNRTVPWAAKSVQQMVNSDYCNQASRNKNCYLCFNGNDSEECAYGVAFSGMRECYDFLNVNTCELSYEIFWADKCYGCFYCLDIDSCRNVWFSKDMSNCQDCVGCAGLRNKQYCILNQQYSKEEYKKKFDELNLGSHIANRSFFDEVRALWLTIPVKYMRGWNNVNVLGDYIESSKNARYCFEIVGGENIKYSQNVAFGVKDSHDYTNWGLQSELIYESVSVGENNRNIKFSFDCWPNCNDLEYCLNCHSSSDLFGCVGLKKKQYCILNKQYTKEEYFTLREKIIAHMNDMPYTDKEGRTYRYGEFFPAEFSPLAYNETIIADYYPVAKEQAVTEGFLWRDPNPREFQTTMVASDLPDHIRDATDDMVKQVIACASCRRAYRIIPSELKFYKRFSLPLPRLCHNCRYRERLAFRNPMKWQRRSCMCAGEASASGAYRNLAPHLHAAAACENTFDTTYPPDSSYTVYCEPCYQAEMA